MPDAPTPPPAAAPPPVDAATLAELDRLAHRAGTRANVGAKAMVRAAVADAAVAHLPALLARLAWLEAHTGGPLHNLWRAALDDGLRLERENETLLARVRELEGERGRLAGGLPHTRDGKPILPGMTVYYPGYYDGETRVHQWVVSYIERARFVHNDPDFPCAGEPHEVYADADAARQALAATAAPGEPLPETR